MVGKEQVLGIGTVVGMALLFLFCTSCRLCKVVVSVTGNNWFPYNANLSLFFLAYSFSGIRTSCVNYLLTGSHYCFHSQFSFQSSKWSRSTQSTEKLFIRVCFFWPHSTVFFVFLVGFRGNEHRTQSPQPQTFTKAQVLYTHCWIFYKSLYSEFLYTRFTSFALLTIFFL